MGLAAVPEYMWSVEVECQCPENDNYLLLLLTHTDTFTVRQLGPCEAHRLGPEEVGPKIQQTFHLLFPSSPLLRQTYS